ncbi:MAG: PAS domain S-box protein [Dehalococcoidia bacterium]
MSRSWSRRSGSIDPGASVVLALALAYAASIALFFRPALSDPSYAFAVGHVPFLIGLVAVACSVRGTGGLERAGTLALGGLLITWELAAWIEPAEIMWGRAQAFPEVTTGLTIAGYAFALFAVLKLAPPQLAVDSRQGFELGAVIVIAAAMLIEYVVPHRDPGSTANVVATAYPVLDALIVTLIILSFFGDTGEGRARSGLLLAGFLGFFVVDVATLGDRTAGRMSPALMDTVRHGFVWLLAMAVVIREDPGIPLPSWVEQDRFITFAKFALPFGVILPGAVAVATHSVLGEATPFLTIGTFIAAALLLGRQWLIAADNRDLYAHRKSLLTSFNAKAAELEREVIERRRAEVALRRTEERFRAVAENLDEGLLLANESGRIVYANPRMAHLAGYDRTEFMGRRAEDVLEPWEEWGPLIQLLGTSEGTSVRREIRSTTFDGEEVWLDGYARSFHPGGDDASVIAIAIDVTARKLSEEEAVTRANALSRHNQALEQLSSSAAFNKGGVRAAAQEIAAVGSLSLPVAAMSVWLVDDAHQTLGLFAASPDLEETADPPSRPLSIALSACPRYLETLRSQGSLDVREVQTDARLSELPQELRGRRGTVSLFDVPVRLFGQTVGVIRAEHAGAPRRWSQSERSFCVSLAGFLATVLEAEKRQEALASAARLAAVLSATPDMVAMFDKDGQAVFVNDAARGALGIPVGADISTVGIETFHPEDARPLIREKGLPAALAAGAWAAETVVAAADGRRIPVSQVILSHSESEGGRYVATIMRDLTEARRAEEEREQLNRKLQDAHKLESLGLLAGGVAHDFNNLLQAMLGNAQIARLAIPPESQIAHESLEELETAANRAGELVRQLLAFSGSGQQGVAATDPSSLVEDTVRLLLAVVSRQASVDMTLAPELPQVEADPVQLRQMVMNLVTNAAEAVGENGGRIEVRTRVMEATPALLKDCFLGESCAPGEYVAIEVEDTGVGMDRETVARIFDPFFTTKSYGHGLGLAAVLGTVRSHGGALHVTSRPRRGTTFTVLLPPLVGEPAAREAGRSAAA